MKYILLAFVAIIVFFIGVVFLGSSGVSNLGECYSSAREKLGNAATLAKDEQWAPDAVCVNDEEILKEMRRCETQVADQWFIPNVLFPLTQKIVRSVNVGAQGIDTRIQKHESECRI